MVQRIFRFRMPLAILAGCLLLLPVSASAQRPTVPQLLPEATLVMVRIRNFKEMSELMNDTSMGRMMKDPQIKPLLDDLYGSANVAFVPVEEKIGLSLNDLRRLPQGEVSFAVIDSGEGNEPTIAAFLDCGDNIKDAEHLLALLVEQAAKDGETTRLEKYREYDVQRVGDAYFVVKEGLVMAATKQPLVHGLLDVWDKKLKDVGTLSDNKSYKTLMSKCSGAKGERPQAAIFVDPMGIVKMATRNNFGARTVLAIMEPLGIYGLKGVGGSMILGTDDFESIAHAHVLLDDPREGAMELIALKNGDTEPEPWVPGNAASYQTMHWDMQQSHLALKKIVDTVQGDGTLDGLLQNFMDRRLALDFKEDILKQLDGRFTHVSWQEPPARVNSECHLFAIEVRNPKKMQETLDKLSEKFVESMMPAASLGVNYYRLPSPQGGRRRGRRRRPAADAPQEGAPAPAEPNDAEPQPPNRNGGLPQGFRRPTPSVGIIDDYLVFSDSEVLFQEAIKTKKSGDGLAGDLEYKLVDSKIARHLKGADRCGLQFNRPEETLRGIYSAISSPGAMAQLERAAERDQGAKVFYEALKRNPLPPYEVLTKYLAPGGGIMADGPSGIHITAFALRREDAKEEEGKE